MSDIANLEARVAKFESLISTMTETHRTLLQENAKLRDELAAQHQTSLQSSLKTIHASVKAELAANQTKK